MIRQIKYTILDETQTRKIEPANPQWAGMQYENNATEVVFDITTLINKMQENKNINCLSLRIKSL